MGRTAYETCRHGIIFANSSRTFSHPAEIIGRVVNEDWFKDVGSAVEIGSGCLRNSKFLLARGIRMSVWERPDTIERYKEEYEAFERKGGVVLESIRPDHYDLALMTFVLETICPEFQRRKILSETRQMLRQQGRLVLGVRASYDVKTAGAKGEYCEIGEGYRTPNRTFIKPYDEASLSRILKFSKFKIERVWNRSPILNVLARPV